MIDALVEAAYGGPTPIDHRAFLEWLQEEDWDYLIRVEDDFALKLEYIAESQFSDRNMEDSFVYEPVEIITDEVRVAHARRVVESITSQYDGYECPSFHRDQTKQQGWSDYTALVSVNWSLKCLESRELTRLARTPPCGTKPRTSRAAWMNKNRF